jgi:RNA polymerase sigma-70 factor (ECF subfamily)
MDPSPANTLASVLSRIRAGERGADDPQLAQRLDDAFSRYEAPLRRLCQRELASFPRQEVEEALQQVLLVAWTRLPEFRAEARFRSWLFGIATRTCANMRRRRREVLADDGLFEPGDPAEPVLSRLRREERDEVLQSAAAAVLDAQEQEVIYLRYVLESSAEEIARDAHLKSVDEVRVVLQRCQRRLRREIGRRLEELGHGVSFFRDGD